MHGHKDGKKTENFTDHCSDEMIQSRYNVKNTNMEQPHNSLSSRFFSPKQPTHGCHS